MIKRLSIKNFKSIKDLEIECKKINLFIGEPNTGKSNILEALGLLSQCRYRHDNTGKKLRDFVRFEKMGNLFYDENLDDTISIKTDELTFELAFEDGRFIGDVVEETNRFNAFDYNYEGAGQPGKYHNFPEKQRELVSSIKFYRFKRAAFQANQATFH